MLKGSESAATEGASDKIAYSMTDAKRITGLGRTRLSTAVSRGELACYRVGRRVLFSRRHLEDFLRRFELRGQHK